MNGIHSEIALVCVHGVRLLTSWDHKEAKNDAPNFERKMMVVCPVQEATREKINLAVELLRLQEDIEALGQRKKIITEQVEVNDLRSWP